MILSMTGFGRAEGVFQEKKINIDIKSLNSKSFDLSIRIPPRYREKEFDIRKLLNDTIIRGKVDCFISCENLAEYSDTKINKDLIQAYMKDLKNISGDAPNFEYLKMAIRMPDVTRIKAEEISEQEWKAINDILSEAISKFLDFRKTEGKILEEELAKGIGNIENTLTKISPFEEERILSVKERCKQNLKDFETIDEVRFYQELAYYSEKLDITEEKVRLAQHLKYYREVMNTEKCTGKKLGFITQEIGREINTLGSKANHYEIQKLVVMMKDDLEKIKEQTLNVL